MSRSHQPISRRRFDVGARIDPIGPTLARLSAEICALTACVGRATAVETMGVLDRRGHLPLRAPGLSSPNRACRLVRTRDGWIAANLAREEDLALMPAWLGKASRGDPFRALARACAARASDDLLAGAELLGLAVSRLGEISSDRLEAPLVALGAPAARRRFDRLRVVDFSALWAGPLCGAIFARMGAAVVKVESCGRPDSSRLATPRFFEHLNGAKRLVTLDLNKSRDLKRLREEFCTADVVITSARARAFSALNIAPADVFADNPSLVWAAITGYGWSGPKSARVAFGDDAAVAGGLVRWTRAGAPRFRGDALADPLTGLAAAAGALRGLIEGGGIMVDAALARCAAGALVHTGARP